MLFTIDEENESGKKFKIEYSTVKPIDKLPDGATVLAECSNDWMCRKGLENFYYDFIISVIGNVKNGSNF